MRRGIEIGSPHTLPSPDASRPYRPRWLTWAPFLIRPPALTQRQWHILLLLAAASVFDRYDLGVLQLALPHIRESLGISEGQISNHAAVIQLGALLSFTLTLAADRWGRRNVLIAVVLGYTLLTGATAFAPSPGAFVVLQFLARAFITAEVLLAVVIIAEEFPAAQRGWGIGALLALSTLGGGLAALLFATIDILPFGWRALYIVGLAPLLFIAWLRRRMPETERFAQRQLMERNGEFWLTLRPVARLASDYPERLAVVAGLVFLFNFAGGAAFFLDPSYLQEAHGWQPWQVSVLLTVAGVGGLFASTVIGILGDRAGRKRVLATCGAVLPVAIIAFYSASGMAVLAVLWVVMALAALGVSVTMLAIGAEIFPTSYRSTVSGARTVGGTLGTSLGLAAHSALYGVVGSQWTAISLLSVLMLASPLLVLYGLPEASGKVLEEVAPER